MSTTKLQEYDLCRLPDGVETLLLKRSPVVNYNSNQTVIYQGQLPHAAFYLLDGEAILKTRRSQKRVRPKALIGLTHLLNERLFSHDLIITPGSHVIVIDKSTCQDLESRGHCLHDILSPAS